MERGLDRSMIRISVFTITSITGRTLNSSALTRKLREAYCTFTLCYSVLHYSVFHILFL